MLKKLPHLLIWILLTACQTDNANTVTQTTLTPPIVTLTPTTQPDSDLIQLADAYKELRDVPGHFGGGEPNEVVDQWQGQKHRLMLEIGARLGTGEYGRNELINLIGPPDHIVTQGDALYQNIESLPSFPSFAASQEFLIYEWRATHDFLFFAVLDNQILTAGWWYALE
jgi:hypothetical protein